MDLNKNRQDWEDEAPELAKIPAGNPFNVPKDYFTELEGAIHARLTIESLDLDRDAGFRIAEDYFDQLPEKIEAALAVEELKTEMQTEGFTVPAGYFEGLEDRINRKVHAPAPVVRKLFPDWMRYAAAASVTIMVAFGLYLNGSRNTISAKLSAVPEQEIVNYLQLYADQMDSQVIVENLEPNSAFSGLSDEVSSQELQYYLEDTSL
ncbi:MAG TPA: hypothetical protein VGD92_01440 [Sphingobacteriaceae bacterium]